MPKTPLMMEFQITKEYLGFATHLVYLGTAVGGSAARRHAGEGQGLDGREGDRRSLHGYAHTGMAGVANIGTDRNWSGSQFDQANWYAFGRLAWNPTLGAARHRRRMGAHDLRSNDPAFVQPIVAMMMASREAAVDYMTPLGLAHLMGTGHHYGPAPWISDLKRPEWNPAYYHRADADGIGFDRGPQRAATRSRSIRRGSPRRFADPARLPERPAAVVPPPALGLPHDVGRHAVERAGASLRPRRPGS